MQEEVRYKESLHFKTRDWEIKLSSNNLSVQDLDKIFEKIRGCLQ